MSSLIRVTDCHLSYAKPLPEPMMIYCKLDILEQTSVNFELNKNIFLKKIGLKISAAACSHACLGLNVLFHWSLRDVLVIFKV